MAYSPEDIVAYEFRTRTRGYDRAEVDEMLDALADQVEREEQDLDDLRARLRDAERRLGDALESESALKRGLVAAQEAADRALDEAREQALEALAAAEREIEERLAAAESDAQAIRAAAEAEAAERRDELVALRAVDEGHRERLRAHLDAQLRLLDELPGPPELASEEPAPDDGHGVEDTGAAWEQDVAEERDPDVHDGPGTHDDPSRDDLPSGEAPDPGEEPAAPEDGDGDDDTPSPIWG
ncbi:MAG: DivIVA domain-containing protein [Nitriliruptoraceae bacterium]